MSIAATPEQIREDCLTYSYVGLLQLQALNTINSIIYKINSTRQFAIMFRFLRFVFCCIFILLLRESDQCAIRARLGVASDLSTTPR